MLSKFYRWAKDTYRAESIESLRDWITEESQYQVKATETVEGLHGAKGKPREEDRKRSNRNFIIVKQKCDICHGGHAVRNCERYKAMSVDDRWKIAKEKNLCFRCLASNHQGKDCRRAKECGLNGCKRIQITADSCINQRKIKNRAVAVVEDPSNSHPPEDASSPSAKAFTTLPSETIATMDSEQGIQEHSHITTLASAQNQENVSLRTAPVWLSANGRKIKVNALLDDASSVSYVNEELAGALGLSATYEQVVVNVLNESVDTVQERFYVSAASVGNRGREMVTLTVSKEPKPLSGHDVSFLMDTGAECNLLLLDVYKKVTGDLNLRFLNARGKSVLVLANGDEQSIEGKATVYVSRKGNTHKIEVNVVRGHTV